METPTPTTPRDTVGGTPPAGGVPPRTGLYPIPILTTVAVVVLLALDPRGRLLLAVEASSVPCLFVYLLAMVLVGRTWRLKAREFAFGFMSPLVVVRWGTCLIRLNVLPLGGYVKWRNEVGGAPSNLRPPIATTPDEDDPRFDSIHPLQRAATCLGGPLASLALAIALLESAGFDSFRRGFGQLAGQLFRPREANLAMYRSFFARVQTGDYL